MSKHQAYTLIELTIVVGLTSLLAIAVTAILFSTMLSSTRIRRVIRLRQTGNYTTTQIQQLIRNATTITQCSPDDNNITFINQDGGQTTIQLENGKIASVSTQATRYFNLDNNMTVSNFLVLCDSNLVKVNFTLTYVSDSNRPSEQPSQTFQIDVAPRNQ